MVLALSGTYSAAQSPVKFEPQQVRRPAGGGPFPAVVLLHTCAGVQDHLREWAARLREAGYATMIVDSFGPRGVGVNCGRWTVSVDEVAADALAARTFLGTLPDIDGKRIAAMGFSYGAFAALRLAGAGYIARSAAGGAFQAIVAFYPSCTAGPTRNPIMREIKNNLANDIATPTLILMGGADEETPASTSEAAVPQLAAQGQPIRLKVYPGVTHAFDQPGEKRTAAGFTHRFDGAAVEDSWAESRAFLQQARGR